MSTHNPSVKLPSLTAEQMVSLRNELKMYHGRPPYDTSSNICRGDGYFAMKIERTYGAKLSVLEALVAEDHVMGSQAPSFTADQMAEVRRDLFMLAQGPPPGMPSNAASVVTKEIERKWGASIATLIGLANPSDKPEYPKHASVPNFHHMIFNDDQVVLLQCVFGSFLLAKQGNITSAMELGRLGSLQSKSMNLDDVYGLQDIIRKHFDTIDCKDPDCKIHGKGKDGE